jgi:hypothetical protein
MNLKFSYLRRSGFGMSLAKNLSVARQVQTEFDEGAVGMQKKSNAGSAAQRRRG